MGKNRYIYLVNRQINKILTFLSENGISISQNFTSCNVKTHTITWDNFQNLTFTLKDLSYEDIYKTCKERGDYNFLLIDKAFIQMKYDFDNRGNSIIGHVLGYYPNVLEKLEKEINEEYQEELQNDSKGITDNDNSLFKRILERKVTPFPIRFDYSQTHNEIIHPKVHLTLGNYLDCRIPVARPIMPYQFVSFILRNFYFDLFQKFNISSELINDIRFNEEITEKEKELFHINF